MLTFIFDFDGVLHVEGRQKRSLVWKLKLLVMYGIKTWFGFWVIALKAPTGTNPLHLPSCRFCPLKCLLFVDGIAQ